LEMGYGSEDGYNEKQKGWFRRKWGRNQTGIVGACFVNKKIIFEKIIVPTDLSSKKNRFWTVKFDKKLLLRRVKLFG